MADLRPVVYIPSLNAEAMLPRTLESLRSQTRPVDVVLVDNGSTDNSVGIARERFGEVEVLELGRNLGFGPAINHAARERPADPMILLNNDIECEPELIAAMLEAHAGGAESVAGVL
ncbi:MAG TPA: glycosyltransferase, partial [Solirubrobacterales bacterium]